MHVHTNMEIFLCVCIDHPYVISVGIAGVVRCPLLSLTSEYAYLLFIDMTTGDAHKITLMLTY